MRILCCGDRSWGSEADDRPLMVATLCRVTFRVPGPDVVIVHGDCRGADKMSGDIADRLAGFVAEPHPADWPRYGRAAGPIRNQAMLDTGVDLVLAFHHDLTRSKGTKDMVEKARAAGVPVEVVG